MISALADAGAALDRADYVSAAVTCARFIEADRSALDKHTVPRAVYLEGISFS